MWDVRPTVVDARFDLVRAGEASCVTIEFGPLLGDRLDGGRRGFALGGPRGATSLIGLAVDRRWAPVSFPVGYARTAWMCKKSGIRCHLLPGSGSVTSRSLSIRNPASDRASV